MRILYWSLWKAGFWSSASITLTKRVVVVDLGGLPWSCEHKMILGNKLISTLGERCYSPAREYRRRNWREFRNRVVSLELKCLPKHSRTRSNPTKIHRLDFFFTQHESVGVVRKSKKKKKHYWMRPRQNGILYSRKWPRLVSIHSSHSLKNPRANYRDLNFKNNESTRKEHLRV